MPEASLVAWAVLYLQEQLPTSPVHSRSVTILPSASTNARAASRGYAGAMDSAVVMADVGDGVSSPLSELWIGQFLRRNYRRALMELLTQTLAYHGGRGKPVRTRKPLRADCL